MDEEEVERFIFLKTDKGREFIAVKGSDCSECCFGKEWDGGFVNCANVACVDFYKLGGSLQKSENLSRYLARALERLRAAGKQIYVKEALRAQAPGAAPHPEETDPDKYNVKGTNHE